MSIEEMANSYANAWTSSNPHAVASYFAEDGEIEINRGDPIRGRSAIAEMAAGFYSDFPDLEVHLDHLRVAGDHVLFGWVLQGTHAITENSVRVPGWEEWDLDAEGRIARSRGWFDAAEYERQIDEGF